MNDEWKKEWSVMYNLRSSVKSYYQRTLHVVEVPKELESYWNSLEYDRLIKVKMLYRQRWLNSLKVE